MEEKEKITDRCIFMGQMSASKKVLISTGFHLPYNPELTERARKLRTNPTPAERKLWYQFLRNFKYPVLRQKPIDLFIVDFYCSKLKLVIEVDGDTHYTDEVKDFYTINGALRYWKNMDCLLFVSPIMKS